MTLEKIHYLSNSEITDFNKCERLHFYKYILRITKDEMPLPLACGIYGHEILSVYYNARIDGIDYANAALKAYRHLDSLQGEIDYKVWNILNTNLMRYFRKHRFDPYIPVSAEKMYRIPVPDREYGFAFRMDLIAEVTVGRFEGKIAVVDHKWTKDFWQPNRLKMYAQLPRYMWALDELGVQTDVGIVAQIRYREFKNLDTADLFAHEFIERDEKRESALMHEFKKAADQVYFLHKMAKEDKELAGRVVKRALNENACNYCPFQTPCSAGLIDKDEELRILKANFVKNTYGYND